MATRKRNDNRWVKLRSPISTSSFSFYAIVAALKGALRIEETNEEKEFRYSPPAGQEFAVGVVMRRRVGGAKRRHVHTCFLRHDTGSERGAREIVQHVNSLIVEITRRRLFMVLAPRRSTFLMGLLTKSWDEKFLKPPYTAFENRLRRGLFS